MGQSYSVKISDFSLCCDLYKRDYYELEIEPGRPFPIRWMAWESILLVRFSVNLGEKRTDLLQNKFSTKTDVWSFGVCLWEILTLAAEQPLAELSDDEVVENAKNVSNETGSEVQLHKPANCAKEIYDLMRECWHRNPDSRPTFREILMFLTRKNWGYNPPLV